ncbi:nitroreductase family deazaflavin-dependent oxidoreductase [Actinoplanes sp. NBC_00393]|uniref:nitroreductase/quinone reductase family protein n=1 Tax=Actinoplanes sp. NBC_00393 TaxID=2975953 RepID=UPI002E1BA234
MWRRLWRAAGSWPVFTPVARRLVTVDRWLGRLTRGRVVALGMAPSLMLTTTGRKSGLPRSNPLQYVRDGDDFIVIASNWGGEHDPAWSYNLRSIPQARVTLDGRDIPVTARETDGPERERLWQLITDQWPGYDNYRTRAAHRRIRVFRLTPAA